MTGSDRNSIAFWFPKLEEAGLPVPKTIIVETDVELSYLLDGQTPSGFDTFLASLEVACDAMGYPCFLRTGHGSGKHQWDETCHVPSADTLGHRVGALVEWSALSGIMGLPTNVWAVREMIPTTPLFRLLAYRNFPLVREFRLFVRDGKVDHVQPYWPYDAVLAGVPDRTGWEQLLERASRLTTSEESRLKTLAVRACSAVGGGYWSVDLLQAADGSWRLTDMALGDESFRYGG
jgi:hypothetical protein